MPPPSFADPDPLTAAAGPRPVPTDDSVEPLRVPPAEVAKTFARLAGPMFFPLAFIGRLPFAMTAVGILTTLVGLGVPVGAAGLVSACAGVATAIGGPAIGAWADRAGQRRILVLLGLVNGGALLVFVALACLGGRLRAHPRSRNRPVAALVRLHPRGPVHEGVRRLSRVVPLRPTAPPTRSARPSRG